MSGSGWAPYVSVASLVELLQGHFNQGVMERLCRPGTGLFPAPREIECSCSCPDGAYMCKHVAAVLYGIGARFDAEPVLLFLLRGVEGRELLAHAATGAAAAIPSAAADKVLAGDDLAALFGLDLAPAPVATPPPPAKRPRSAKPVPAPAKAKAKAPLPAEAPARKTKPKARPRKKPVARRGVLD